MAAFISFTVSSADNTFISHFSVLEYILRMLSELVSQQKIGWDSLHE